MEESKLQEDLASIRNMMERSSRFLSLSGLSGVMCGIYAIIGAALAYAVIYQPFSLSGYRDYDQGDHYTMADTSVILFTPIVAQLLFIALSVLTASLVTVYMLTRRKAKKQGQVLWGKSSKTLVFQMCVPLLTGGMFILIMLTRGYIGIVSPACLAFYGLALVAASAYTYKDIKYLGLCEIALGIIAAAFPGYGLLFWALGFGALHIIYGTLLYSKYDG